jgi:hypothetical protein
VSALTALTQVPHPDSSRGAGGIAAVKLLIYKNSSERPPSHGEPSGDEAPKRKILQYPIDEGVLGLKNVVSRYAPVAWQTLHLEYLDSENEWNMLEDDGDLLNAHAQTGGTLKVRICPPSPVLMGHGSYGGAAPVSPSVLPVPLPLQSSSLLPLDDDIKRGHVQLVRPLAGQPHAPISSSSPPPASSPASSPSVTPAPSPPPFVEQFGRGEVAGGEGSTQTSLGGR